MASDSRYTVSDEKKVGRPDHYCSAGAQCLAGDQCSVESRDPVSAGLNTRTYSQFTHVGSSHSFLGVVFRCTMSDIVIGEYQNKVILYK